VLVTTPVVVVAEVVDVALVEGVAVAATPVVVVTEVVDVALVDVVVVAAAPVVVGATVVVVATVAVVAVAPVVVGATVVVVATVAVVVGTGSTISVLLLHAEANSTNARTRPHDLIGSTASTLRADQEDSQKSLPVQRTRRFSVGLPRFELGTFGPPDRLNPNP